jgi:hypothetical protein
MKEDGRREHGIQLEEVKRRVGNQVDNNERN